MHNPFANVILGPAGPATDILPIVPSDGADLPAVASALYVQGGGVVRFDTLRGQTRTVTVADFSLLPVAVRRVRATGTTATGLHALVVGA